MATTLLSWGGKTLEVTPTKVYSFEDAGFSGGVKTKDSKQGNINKVEMDALEAASYEVTALLDARLGVDVQSEVTCWLRAMRSIVRSNLILGGQDVFGVPFMLTKCEAKKIRMTGKGIWLSAELDLEFEECVSGSPNTVSAVTITNPASGAANLLTWGGKTLGVKPTQIYSFEDIEIGGGVKTKDSKQGNINKVDSDGLDAASYAVSIPLDARWGVDVQAEARSWMSLMRNGTKSNIIVTGQDVFGVPFMLTKCEAKDVRMTASGAWLKVMLELEFEETYIAPVSTGGGGSSGSGGGSSSKKKSSGSKATSYKAGDDVDVISMAAPKAPSSSSSGNLSGAIGGFVSSVTSAIKNVISNAKSNSSSAKSSSSSTKSSSSSVKSIVSTAKSKASSSKK